VQFTRPPPLLSSVVRVRHEVARLAVTRVITHGDLPMSPAVLPAVSYGDMRGG
jgi:hypothetical protein